MKIFFRVIGGMFISFCILELLKIISAEFPNLPLPKSYDTAAVVITTGAVIGIKAFLNSDYYNSGPIESADDPAFFATRDEPDNDH